MSTHGRRTGIRSIVVAWGAPVLVGVIAFGCGSAKHPAEPASTTKRATSTTTQPDVRVTAASFRSLKTMTPVRGFFVANLEGNLAGTLAVANSKTGGVYPPGTLLQLVPQEAMVNIVRAGTRRRRTGSSSSSTSRPRARRSSRAVCSK